MAKEPLLQIKDLQTLFRIGRDQVLRAVDRIDLQIEPGETLAIVGESGSGKSITALSIMGLLSGTSAQTTGEIRFQDRDLLQLDEKAKRKLRGKDIAMIFQEPMTSLNPVYRIGEQISEVLRLHKKMKSREAMREAVEMLRLVGIPSPETRVHDYPHQLSGGMRQRVMIAMAICCNPALLIADEPTTALDVTIQAQILDLIKNLQRRLGMAVLLITHDLGVVAESADRVLVMYAGQVMEQGTVAQLFEKPLHPYTEGLLRSIPQLDTVRGELHAIPGTVPSLADLPTGCVFSTRCESCMDICRESRPVVRQTKDGRRISCWLYEEEGDGHVG